MTDPTESFTQLPERLSFLAEAASLADPAMFAEAASGALAQAGRAIAALVTAVDEMHNWAIETPQHAAARLDLYRLVRSLGGRKF